MIANESFTIFTSPEIILDEFIVLIVWISLKINGRLAAKNTNEKRLLYLQYMYESWFTPFL